MLSYSIEHMNYQVYIINSQLLYCFVVSSPSSLGVMVVARPCEDPVVLATKLTGS